MSNWQPPQGQFPQGQIPPGQPQQYRPPASSFYGAAPPQKSSSAGLWIALAVAGAVLLVCGGGCGALVFVGLNVAEEEIAVQLRDNPKLREHVGEIESLDMDIIASGAEDDDDVFVYRVKGSKGSGKLTIREGTSDDFDTIVEEATLRLPDGTTVPIVP
jgi:hypothetical protein